MAGKNKFVNIEISFEVEVSEEEAGKIKESLKSQIFIFYH